MDKNGYLVKLKNMKSTGMKLSGNNDYLRNTGVLREKYDIRREKHDYLWESMMIYIHYFRGLVYAIFLHNIQNCNAYFPTFHTIKCFPNVLYKVKCIKFYDLIRSYNTHL